MIHRIRFDRLRTMERRARPLFAFLLDLFFPPRCVYCHTLGNRICGPCAAAIPWIGPDHCAACGLPQGEHRPHACIDRSRLRFVRSAAVFSGPMRKALHALKYDSDRSLASRLIGLSHPHWKVPSWDFDLLLPVPLGRTRERARGYNQSLLLARALSGFVHIPVAADRLLRVRETPSQVGLTYPQRKQNVADAFCASSVEGSRTLLVDDVCTTGATLQSCADTLRRAGASDVGAVTLARADLPDARSTVPSS